jgi:hypothetical protein
MMHRHGYNTPASFFDPAYIMGRSHKASQTPTGIVITDGHISMDWKPAPATAKGGGYTSILALKHIQSKYVLEYPFKSESSKAVVESVTAFKHHMLNKFDVSIHTILADRDATYVTKLTTRPLSTIGIECEFGGAEDHGELGSIETYFRGWGEHLASYVYAADKDDSYWWFAASTYNHMYNRSPHAGNAGLVSPLEYLTGSKPELDHFRVPLCDAYVHDNDAHALDTLATSTTESEYIAAFEATREVRRQRIQLAPLGLPQLLPTPLYEDNESAIRIATAGNGDSSSERRQHIDGKYHWLCRAITDGIIDMVYCETAHQAADSLTKPLARDLVKRFHNHQAGRQRMPIPQHTTHPGASASASPARTSFLTLHRSSHDCGLQPAGGSDPQGEAGQRHHPVTGSPNGHADKGHRARGAQSPSHRDPALSPPSVYACSLHDWSGSHLHLISRSSPTPRASPRGRPSARSSRAG